MVDLECYFMFVFVIIFSFKQIFKHFISFSTIQAQKNKGQTTVTSDPGWIWIGSNRRARCGVEGMVVR